MLTQPKSSSFRLSTRNYIHYIQHISIVWEKPTAVRLTGNQMRGIDITGNSMAKLAIYARGPGVIISRALKLLCCVVADSICEMWAALLSVLCNVILQWF